VRRVPHSAHAHAHAQSTDIRRTAHDINHQPSSININCQLRRCTCSGSGSGSGQQGAFQKKEKENKEQKNNLLKKQPTDFPFLFSFLGAPCVGCGPSVDMPPHVGTRSWLWGLPLRASSL
jgi:hypothetical protein